MYKAFCLFLLFFLCRPSEFLRKRYADFNFTDEGFLSPSLLQTIGHAQYQSAKGGARNDKRLCLELAQREARKRLLRIVLHVRLNLKPPQSKAAQLKSKDHLALDYPFHFQETDFLRAELDFASFLDDAYIALQDSRDVKSCMVVYRIEGEELPQKIRQIPLTFQPKL